jgi:hypothetical protein
VKPIVLLCLLAALAACGTPYRQRGTLGYGVQATRIDGETYRIEANGNQFNTRASLENYVMRKAAEVTLESGNDIFQMFGGTTYEEHREEPQGMRAKATIKVYPGPKPSNAPANVYDARDVLIYLGKTS